MTYEQIITLFERIADNHEFINTFGKGEDWEINSVINPENKDFVLWVSPGQFTTQEQTKQRTFNVVVWGRTLKDKSNETHLISDSEQILDDVIKILKYNSQDYEVIGEPVITPFIEGEPDFVAGCRTEITIQTDFANNNCDMPVTDYVSPESVNNTVRIINTATGEVIATLNPSSNYYVTVLSAIQDTIDSNEVTIIENLD